MGGEETGGLGHGLRLAVDDECHEQQSKRQVLRIEINDEEGDLASGVVLGEGVRVGEREGRKEGICVQEDASDGLNIRQQWSPSTKGKL